MLVNKFITSEDKSLMMSSCWQVSFFPTSETSSLFEDFLEEFFEVTAQNYADNGQDEYIGYQSGNFNEQEMLMAAKKRNLVLPPYKITHLESSNWLKDYVIQFSPFEICDFMIYGIHEKTTPQTKKIPLQIYAATAFGSDHPTTRCCLRAISDLYHKGYQVDKILDVGTGSGILSLAAAKLWQKARLIAVDIDEEAVLVTQSNAQTNALDNQITCAQSDGYQADIVHNNAPYDLILANILARPLIEMSPNLAQNFKKNGYCILSGFVAEQADWIISEHQKQGLTLIKEYSQDNWRAILMQKA